MSVPRVHKGEGNRTWQGEKVGQGVGSVDTKRSQKWYNHFGKWFGNFL